jgi:hypothetical protein
MSEQELKKEGHANGPLRIITRNMLGMVLDGIYELMTDVSILYSSRIIVKPVFP